MVRTGNPKLKMPTPVNPSDEVIKQIKRLEKEQVRTEKGQIRKDNFPRFRKKISGAKNYITVLSNAPNQLLPEIKSLMRKRLQDGITFEFLIPDSSSEYILQKLSDLDNSQHLSGEASHLIQLKSVLEELSRINREFPELLKITPIKEIPFAFLIKVDDDWIFMTPYIPAGKSKDSSSIEIIRKKEPQLFDNLVNSVNQLKQSPERPVEISEKNHFLMKIKDRLRSGVNETLDVEFKSYLINKLDIAKSIACMFNLYILSNEISYIVFQIKDQSHLEKEGVPKEKWHNLSMRYISEEDFMEKSRLSPNEGFQKSINQIVQKHIKPDVSSILKLDTIDLCGELGVNKPRYLYFLKIDNYPFDEPCKAQSENSWEVVIRKTGACQRATSDEIMILMKKLFKKESQNSQLPKLTRLV